MTRWIDAMSAAQRNELTDAGRIGSGRFAGPLHECAQCGSTTEDAVPLERKEWLCRSCQRLNADRYERMTGSGEAA